MMNPFRRLAVRRDVRGNDSGALALAGTTLTFAGAASGAQAAPAAVFLVLLSPPSGLMK
jgi:hypothetical protein